MERTLKARGNMVSPVLLGIVVVFVSFMLISNILANRMIQVGAWALDAGTLTFPVTYVISDIVSEIYGYKWSRRIAWISAAMNAILALFILTAIRIPHPEWFDASHFAMALGSSYRIVIASIAAYVLGDWVNDVIFREMKKRNPNATHFKLRAIFSSVGGSIVDTSVFVVIAFTFLMPASEMVPMVVISVIAKTAYEILILPLTVKVLKVVERKESEYTETNYVEEV